jgi:hypothetical protein
MMASERWVSAFIDTVRNARAEPLAGWLDRALARIAQRQRARARRRLVAALACAAAVLTALGLTPFPYGSARGVWAQAVATAASATSLHVRGRIVTESGEFAFEQWLADDGFSRADVLQGDRLLAVSLVEPGRRQVIPDVAPGRSLLPEHVWPAITEFISVGLLGPRLQGAFARTDLVPFPGHVAAHGLLQGDDESRVCLGLLEDLFDLRIDERREKTLVGGPRVVVTAEGTARHNVVIGDPFLLLPVFYLTGEEIRLRAEVDPETDVLSSLVVWKSVEGRWRETYAADVIDYGAEVTDEVRDIRVPRGHVELADHWWEGRLDTALASDHTDDWEVTVHALDVNRGGDLFVTFARRPRRGTELASEEWCRRLQGIAVRAVDSSGVEYLPSTKGHRFHTPQYIEGHPVPVFFGIPETAARVRLTSARAPSLGSAGTSVTVTINNGSPTKGMQSVEFPDLPLPPRQSGDDLIAEAYEKRYF